MYVHICVYIYIYICRCVCIYKYNIYIYIYIKSRDVLRPPNTQGAIDASGRRNFRKWPRHPRGPASDMVTAALEPRAGPLRASGLAPSLI